MATIKKIFFDVMSGTKDNNIKFDDLHRLLNALQFESVRTKGSHHHYRNNNIAESVNIQKDGSKAKGYQVKQVREIIIDYNLEV